MPAGGRLRLSVELTGQGNNDGGALACGAQSTPTAVAVDLAPPPSSGAAAVAGTGLLTSVGATLCCRRRDRHTPVG